MQNPKARKDLAIIFQVEILVKDVKLSTSGLYKSSSILQLQSLSH